MGLNNYFVMLVVFAFVGYCNAVCPSGEYNPGPDCSFEVICGLPSAHTFRRHYCDCWCNPGLIRDSVSGACVEKCPLTERALRHQQAAAADADPPPSWEHGCQYCGQICHSPLTRHLRKCRKKNTT